MEREAQGDLIGAELPESAELQQARSGLARLAAELAKARQELDQRRAELTSETHRKRSMLVRLRDWLSGAGAKRIAVAERALARAERSCSDIEDRYRRQAEWTRLLATAHDIHVKEQRAPAAGSAEKLQVVQEARRTLQKSPRAVRWGPVSLIAQAMRRIHYRPYVLAAEEEEAAASRDGRSWIDLWGVPREGPR